MTVERQKKIKYIPIIQFVTMFYWLGYYKKNNLKYGDFLKTLFKMFGFTLVMNIPRMILHFVFKSDLLDIIIFYLSVYPYFWGLATLAVADQEQHEKRNVIEKSNSKK